MSFSSAIYEGMVTHRRLAPHPHLFHYKMAQLYLDLDEVDKIFNRRWLWSSHGRNVAEFRRGDYLGDSATPLAQAVRERASTVLGYLPAGSVCMLAHLRYAGMVFNPVTFYYCHDAGGALECIVAEITNTPWKERHSYVLPVRDAARGGDWLRWEFDKRFHVSPFVPMDRTYDWRFSTPGDHLRVRMEILRDGEREFDAHLRLERRALTGPTLARVLWRYPLMSVQVVGAIHWHALRLWLKGNPVHDHPSPQGVSK